MEFSKEDLGTILTACLSGSAFLGLRLTRPNLTIEDRATTEASMDKMRELYVRIVGELGPAEATDKMDELYSQVVGRK